MKMRPEVLIRISFELKSYQRKGRKFMNTLPSEKILQGRFDKLCCKYSGLVLVIVILAQIDQLLFELKLNSGSSQRDVGHSILSAFF